MLFSVLNFKACGRAKKLVNDQDVESIFYVAGIMDTLGSACKVSFSQISIILDTTSVTGIKYLFHRTASAT